MLVAWAFYEERYKVSEVPCIRIPRGAAGQVVWGLRRQKLALDVRDSRMGFNPQARGSGFRLVQHWKLILQCSVDGVRMYGGAML